MGIRTYSIEEVVTCLGLSRTELHQWVSRKYFRPLHKPSRGRARKFTFEEILYLGIFCELRSISLPLDFAFSLAETAYEYKQDKCPRIIMDDEISLLIDVEKIENKIREQLSPCQ